MTRRYTLLVAGILAATALVLLPASWPVILGALLLVLLFILLLPPGGTSPWE